MIQVMIACIPGYLTSIYFFGNGIVIQTLIAFIAALLSEGLVAMLRSKSIISTLGDCSALLTALLLSLSLPPLSPWWMIVLAIIFAIIIAKQLYGGLGYNIFNPAMIGYAVLLVSFPSYMTYWLPQQNLLLHSISLTDSIMLIFKGTTSDGLMLQQLYINVDGITQATPLESLKTEKFYNDKAIFSKDQLNWQTNQAWLYININFLLCGLYLIWRRIISWHIPFSFLSAMFISAWLGQCLIPEVNISPLFHMFSGATMLGAFFISTDPVTTATTMKGRIIFGALAGILVWLIRTWGIYPDGVAFSVLLVNICAPLIDYYTQPKVYNHK